MKLKLPCCEINKKSSTALWECSYCDCFFENAELRDAHNREIHPQQLAAKRNMKCCDNKKKRGKKSGQYECRYCCCTFQTSMGCDSHMKDVHQCKCGAIMLTDDTRIQHKTMHEQEVKLEKLQSERGAKRKMKCCQSPTSKIQKFDYQCHYCDSTFPNKTGCDYHMIVHQCKCGVIMITDEVRAHHKAMHEEEAKLEELQSKREAQLEKLQKQRQRKMDDDFVLIYLKANKPNEYRPQADYEPDFGYIMGNRYHFEKDELVRFVKKFKKEYLEYLYDYNEAFGSAEIIDLAENDALSTEDVASFLHCSRKILPSEEVIETVSYLMDKDYKIESEWVAIVIDDDELIERIKQKYTFTFDEIYKALKYERWNEDPNELYSPVHRHFPDPRRQYRRKSV